MVCDILAQIYPVLAQKVVANEYPAVDNVRAKIGGGYVKDGLLRSWTPTIRRYLYSLPKMSNDENSSTYASV